MRGTTRTVAIAGVSALALLTAACSGDSGGGTSSTSGNASASSSDSATGAAGGEISISGCTPQNPFIPAMTNETCGGDMLDEVLARLVHYNSDDAKPELDLAESIETTDNQNFTVKLKQGRKFSDGTEVKAANFVKAWNWNRAGANGTLNSYFFDVIDGAADMDCGLVKVKDKETGEDVEQPDCDKKPAKTEELSGLKIVDDYTFTIKTTEKVSNLLVRLGYSAFAPLPDSFFADNGKAYGAKPVGAGPYMMESYDPATGAVLVKNPDYSGDFAGNVDKITFKIYQDTEAAYKDVMANQTDLLAALPASALQGEKYKSDLPDRTAEKATGTIAIDVNDDASIAAAAAVGAVVAGAAFGHRHDRHDHLPLAQGGQDLRQPGVAQGDLHGDRPRHDHQDDPRQHAPGGDRLGLPGRGRLQGRPVW